MAADFMAHQIVGGVDTSNEGSNEEICFKILNKEFLASLRKMRALID